MMSKRDSLSQTLKAIKGYHGDVSEVTPHLCSYIGLMTDSPIAGLLIQSDVYDPAVPSEDNAYTILLKRETSSTTTSDVVFPDIELLQGLEGSADIVRTEHLFKQTLPSNLSYLPSELTIHPLGIRSAGVHPNAYAIIGGKSSGDKVSNIREAALVASITLENALLRNEITLQSNLAKTVEEIGQYLTSSLQIDKIFQRILTSIRLITDAEDVTIGHVNEATNEVILEKALLEPELADQNLPKIKLGQGIAGWVALHGEALNVPDPYSDPRFFKEMDAATGYITRSILCVPLKVADKVVGVLEAVNKHTGAFTAEDERILTALSPSIAIAIDKAQLHSQVLAEKSRVETLLTQMSEGFLTIDDMGIITEVNPAFASMLQTTPNHLKGKSVELIKTDPDVFSRMKQGVDLDKETDKTFNETCELVLAEDSRLPIMVAGARVQHDPSESSYETVVIVSDVTQILEVERMKDDFVANVTHELRTPLATILLYARLLQGGRVKGDAAREARYLSIIEEQSNHLQVLVRQVLDLARMRSDLSYSIQEEVLLDKLLEELVSQYRRVALEKEVSIVLQCQSDLVPIESNREALFLVFSNLIDNAVKFTHKGSVEILVDQTSAGTWVKVSDEGIGIPQESIPHLFRRFYRARSAVEHQIGGSGIGLALVKEALDKIGGEISVGSKESDGSTFTVFLPLS